MSCLFVVWLGICAVSVARLGLVASAHPVVMRWQNSIGWRRVDLGLHNHLHMSYETTLDNICRPHTSTCSHPRCKVHPPKLYTSIPLWVKTADTDTRRTSQKWKEKETQTQNCWFSQGNTICHNSLFFPNKKKQSQLLSLWFLGRIPFLLFFC